MLITSHLNDCSFSDGIHQGPLRRKGVELQPELSCDTMTKFALKRESQVNKCDWLDVNVAEVSSNHFSFSFFQRRSLNYLQFNLRLSSSPTGRWRSCVSTSSSASWWTDSLCVDSPTASHRSPPSRLYESSGTYSSPRWPSA